MSTDLTEPRQILDEGVRYERNGLLDAALERYWTAAERATETALIVEAFTRLTDAYRGRCEWDRALEAARRGAELARAAGLEVSLGEVLNAEAIVHQAKGDFAAAEPILEEVLTLAADDRVCGVALQNLGTIAAQRRDFETAERRFVDSRRHFQRAGYQRGEAIALVNRAAVALDRGDPTLAASSAEQAVVIAKQLGDLELLGVATLNYAEALARQERYAEAEDHASTALGYFAIAGNTLRRVEGLRLLASIYTAQHDTETGRRCYVQALELAKQIEAARIVEELERVIGGL